MLKFFLENSPDFLAPSTYCEPVPLPQGWTAGIGIGSGREHVNVIGRIYLMFSCLVWHGYPCLALNDFGGLTRSASPKDDM